MEHITRNKQRNSEKNQRIDILSGNLQQRVEKIRFENGQQYKNTRKQQEQGR